MRFFAPRPPNVIVICRALALCLAALVAGRLAAAIDSPTRSGCKLHWTPGNWPAAAMHIAQMPLPWIIVYDDAHAWHVNPERDLLPPHTRTSQTVHFSGRKYEIFEVMNRGKVWVPGRPPVLHRGLTSIPATVIAGWRGRRRGLQKSPHRRGAP